MAKTQMHKQFKEYLESFRKKVPQEQQELMNRAIKELEESGVAMGLRKGQQAPDFTLPDANGKDVRLYEELKKGPVILTFYRGGWCPYCNMELRAYQSILDDIHQAGGQLIAVSPQTPDNSLSTKEKNELRFHVLSDVGNKVAQKYNLVYRLPDYLIELYKERGLNIADFNGDDSWTLPVSATYIIGQDGKIAFEYTKADYKDRAEPSEVLDELKKLVAKSSIEEEN
jgi:peroxiredoxin